MDRKPSSGLSRRDLLKIGVPVGGIALASAGIGIIVGRFGIPAIEDYSSSSSKKQEETVTLEPKYKIPEDFPTLTKIDGNSPEVFLQNFHAVFAEFEKREFTYVPDIPRAYVQNEREIDFAAMLPNNLYEIDLNKGLLQDGTESIEFSVKVITPRANAADYIYYFAAGNFVRAEMVVKSRDGSSKTSDYSKPNWQTDLIDPLMDGYNSYVPVQNDALKMAREKNAYPPRIAPIK